MIDSECCPDIDFVFYDEGKRIESIIGPGCCSLVDTTTTSFSQAFLQHNIQTFKISPNHLFIQGVQQGEPYSLFDLNGKLLFEGNITKGCFKNKNSPDYFKNSKPNFASEVNKFRFISLKKKQLI